MSIERDILEQRIILFIEESVANGNGIPSDEQIEAFIEEELQNIEIKPSFSEVSATDLSWKAADRVTFNTRNRQIASDLQLLHRVFRSIFQRLIRQKSYWSKSIAQLDTRARALKNQLNTLLLYESGAEGFVGTITAMIGNGDAIDAAYSTELNQSHGSINARIDSEDTIYIAPDRVSYSAASDNVLSLAEKHGIENLVLADDSSWLVRAAAANRDRPVSLQINVLLSDGDPIEYSTLAFYANETLDGTSLLVMDSLDGTSYSRVVEPKIISSQTATHLVFAPRLARKVRIFIVKHTYDLFNGEQYIFDFSARQLILANVKYKKDNYTTIITKPLFYIDPSLTSGIEGYSNPSEAFHSITAGGVLREFNSVKLTASETLQDATSISYSIAFNQASASEDSSFPIDSSTQWRKISPANRANPIYPTHLVLSENSNLSVEARLSFDENGGTNKIGDTYKVFDSSGNTVSYTDSNKERYFLPNEYTGILDVQISRSSLSSIQYDKLRLLRNVGGRQLSDSINGYARGWFLGKDQLLHTQIEITSHRGFTVDLGEKPAIIDGKEIRQTHTLSPGIHTVAIYPENAEFYHGYSDSAPSNIDELKDIDSRYPHNHFLIFNGVPSNWPATKDAYQGADILCEQFMRYVDLPVFMRKISNDDKRFFTIESTDTVGYSAPILIKTGKNMASLKNANFILEMPVRGLTYYQARVKIELETKDQSVTPLVDSIQLSVI